MADVGRYGTMGEKSGISPLTIRDILVRDYVLSFFAFFLFLIAFNSLVPTLPLYLARLGSKEREIGILVGAIGVASLVSRLLVGRVLRRHSERLVMMGGALLFALCFLALIAFRPFWPFLVVRLFQGIAFASLDTAAIAYAIRIVPEAYRARGITYFLLATSLAAATAATSSVFVVNRYGFTVLILACSGLSLCALLLSWKLKDEPARSVVTSPVENALFFQPKILAPAVVSFLFFSSWAGVGAFFPLYSVECGVANPGYFFSAASVMIILVRVLGGRVFDMYGKEKIIPAFILVSAVGFVILSFSSTLPMFILVGLLMGAALAFLIPVTMAYALEYAGSSDGSTVGTYQASMDLGLALGPVTMGIIVPLTGYRVMFLCLAFTSLVSLGYFQFYLRKKGSVTARGSAI
jgi:MFS family permease